MRSRSCGTRMSTTLMRCERSSTARMIRTSRLITLERHSTVGAHLVCLPTACAALRFLGLACLALRFLGLACCGLHRTLAASTCRSFCHPVSGLHMLHHSSHSSARTCATRAGKLGHYIQGLDFTHPTSVSESGASSFCAGFSATSCHPKIGTCFLRYFQRSLPDLKIPFFSHTLP